MPCTVTIPSLGGVSRTFDYIRVDFQPEARVSEHPVELGADVADHIQLLPARFTVEAFVSDSPTRIPEPFAVAMAVQFLELAQGKLVTVTIDGEGVWLNCVLERWPHSKSLAAARSFPLAFRQVRIASALSVPIPPRMPAPVARVGAPTEQDLGTQAPTDGKPSSMLFNLGSFLFGGE